MIGMKNSSDVCQAAVVTAPNCLHFEGNEGSDNVKKCAEVMRAYEQNLSKNRQVMSDKSERQKSGSKAKWRSEELYHRMPNPI